MASGDASPRAFLASLYAHYPVKPGAPAFDPTGSNAVDVFDRSTVALIRADLRHSRGGVGVSNDSDPLCDCQDDGGMTAVEIGSIAKTGDAAAVAHVRLRFASTARDVRIVLRKAGGHWRIHDIGSSNRPSLRSAITSSLRDAR
jgi:ribosomal protein S28E/S33